MRSAVPLLLAVIVGTGAWCATLNVGPGETYATISSAVAAATAGDTIQVAAGSYSEYVTLSKSLTLRGANAGIPAATGNGTAPGGRGPETIMTGGAIVPAAADCTIDGLKFTGTGVRRIDSYASSDNLRITNCIFDFTTGHSGGGSIQLDSGSRHDLEIDHNLMLGATNGNSYLYLGGPAGTYDGLSIHNNDFKGSTVYAVFNGPGSGAQITDNYFTTHEAGLNMGALANPTITGNTFENMYLGLQIGTTGGVLSNNEFSNITGDAWARAIDLFGGQWGTMNCAGLQVTGNEVTGSEGPGIYVRAGVGDASVTGNTVTDCLIGIYVRVSGGIDTLSPDITISNNAIAGSGTTGFMLEGITGPVTELDLGSTSIAAGYTEFIRLVSTQVDVDARSVTFGGANSGAEIEARVYHVNDDPALGEVLFYGDQISGNVLAWDKDDQKFYLTGDASDPASGVEVETGKTYYYGGNPLVVNITGVNGDKQAVVSGASASNALRVRWYMLGGSLYRAYEWSTIGASAKTAVFQRGQTYIYGEGWQSGFRGFCHTISNGPTWDVAYSAVQQP